MNKLAALLIASTMSLGAFAATSAPASASTTTLGATPSVQMAKADKKPMKKKSKKAKAAKPAA